MIVNFLLANRFPLLLWWGPEYTQIYNDAYIPIPGAKHPKALGQRASDCWPEIWHVLQPLIDTPFKGGPATWMEDLELEVHRSNLFEETHFTVAYSPVPDETAPNGIGGVLATVHEITDKIVGERRISTLRDLGAGGSEGNSAEERCAFAAGVLSNNPKDIPFALIYLIEPDGSNAKLISCSHVEMAGPGSPAVIELKADGSRDSVWPLSQVLQTQDVVLIEGLAGRFEGNVPLGVWSDPPNQAVVVPIRSSLAHQLAGFLVAGISPRLKWDESYGSFLDLAARQIATIIASARAYEEERKRAEALAEVDRAKTLFFSNVSHEFRTPLTLMLGPLEDALSAQNGLSADQRERLEVAHRNSLRLLKLVNTLLDFSRIEAGRIQACYEPTDLASYTAELASVFRSAIERAGLKLVITCPQISEPIYLDREMWEKIVFNLLSNSFKFTFAGEINVALRETKGAVELSVRDTGTGIPPADLPHLFERFYRVNGTRGRTFEGSGIGLALVQELAKLHGGMVRVESQLNWGSIFTVTIPLGKSHLPSDRIAAGRTQESTGLRGEAYVQEALRWLPNSQGSADDSPFVPSTADLQLPYASDHAGENRSRILLADDNADMREYVQRLLKNRYEVFSVADGISALQSSKQHAPDLVIADVMMPRMDGFGLLQELRADENLRTIPVILLSARAGEESRIEGLRAGADDYLSKPFSARELLARVGSHLALARVRRHAAGLERQLREKAELEESRMRELFLQAPAAICLLSGPDHRHAFVNREYLRATGRTQPEDFVGKTLGEALPELESQGFGKLLDAVYSSGVAHIATESRVFLNRARDGQPDEVYFNFVCQPMRDLAGRIEGILIHAVEVTPQVLARQELESRERQFRELAETLDVEVRARTRELEARNAEVLRQWKQLRELSWQLLHAQDEERRHIARELHDTAGQTLAVLSMNLSILVNEVKQKAPDIARSAEETSEVVRQLTTDIRTMSYLLHPPLLDENGLPAALSWYIGGLSNRSGLDINFTISEQFGRLPREMELAIFRLVQECLTNIHRHSESKCAAIQILRESARVLIEVRDQGKGIPKERLAEIQTKGSGVGIRGMRERLRQFQGEVIIDSPGAGTTVFATIPITSEGRAVEGHDARSASLGI